MDEPHIICTTGNEKKKNMLSLNMAFLPKKYFDIS